MVVLVVGSLLASVAIGYLLNRLVILRIRHEWARRIALSASRAVFYAPSMVDVGHGVLLPAPLLEVLAYSRREFGPELDLLTFLLPATVFLGSLAFGWSRRFGAWFSTLLAMHLALFWALPLALSSFDARLAWLSINAMPWYPLQRLGLPVTRYGLLTLPNAVGWLWCLVVWAALYALLAMALVRMSAKR